MLSAYLARWTIHEIGTLDQSAFVTQFSFPISEDFSLSFWYCAEQANRKQVIISIKGLLEIYLEENKFVVEISFNNHVIVQMKTVQPDLGEWHHIAITVGETVQLYVDGQLAKTQILPSTINTQPKYEMCIGGYTDAAGGHFDYTFGRNQTGWVDDVRWYSRTLTAQHILELQPEPMPMPDVSIEVKRLNKGILEFTAIADIFDAFIFLWDFGDSHSDIGSTATHEYAFSGTYPVRLTVVSPDYQQLTHEEGISVTGNSKALEATPVFVNEEEGYACYRIPSIVKAANGDLVAFAEARLASCSDSTPVIRLVCKRSHDNGKTWTPVQVVARNLIDGCEYAVQQNAPVVDTVHGTGRIILLYNKLENSEFEIAKGKGSSRIFCIESDDNGKTWHSEKDISAQVHRPKQWRVQRPTLGHAIQLEDGRLLFAGMMTDGDNSVFQSQNYVFWSDDLGKTWAIGGMIPYIGLNEATAVQLENGDLMINSRAYQNEKPVGRRAITIGHFADDNTMEFDETYFDETLIEPTIQASLIRYTSSQQIQFGAKSRILFCNPNHTRARYNLSVRLSYDEAKTWVISKTIAAGPSAYSDLVIQGDMRIGVFYERGNQGSIFYTNFTLDWLTDGQDTIEE